MQLVKKYKNPDGGILYTGFDWWNRLPINYEDIAYEPIPDNAPRSKKVSWADRVKMALNNAVNAPVLPAITGSTNLLGTNTYGSTIGNELKVVGAGAAAVATPAAVTTLAPGSGFWINPLVQQTVASTVGGEATNLASQVATGRTFGQNVGNLISLTGWNPNNSAIGSFATEFLNPGYLLSPVKLTNGINMMGAHSLEILPLVGFGSKAVGSIYKNFTNSIAKNREVPLNATNKSILSTDIKKKLADFWYDVIGPKVGNSMDKLYNYLENNSSYGRGKLKEYLFGTNYIPYSIFATANKIGDAYERVSGGIKYAQNFVNIPEEDFQHMMSNTIARNAYEKLKAGYSEEAIKQEVLKQVNVLRNNIKIADHSIQEYVDAGYPDAVGLHTRRGDTHYISIRRGSSNQKGTRHHEERHALQDAYERTEEQNNILHNAYSDDFLNLEKYKGCDMLSEAETTNLESREVLMDKYFYYTDDFLKQNDFIDRASDYQIFNAVENSNGYGQNYIEYLRKNNLLTPEKAQAFREAMKHVGGYIIGIGTTGIIGNKYFNQDKNKNQQLRNGGRLKARNGSKIPTWQDILNAAEMARVEEAQREQVLRNSRIESADYTTQSNDKTIVVNNNPDIQQEYNTHLPEFKGDPLAWDKAHPNLASWRNLVYTSPYIIASAPLAAGVSGAAGTVGSAIAKAATASRFAPIAQGIGTGLKWLNRGLTAGFAAHGVHNISQGNFTPMTALELAPIGIAGKALPAKLYDAETRAIETAMRTTSAANPLPVIGAGIKSMLQGQAGGTKRLYDIGRYILTGRKAGVKGYYNSFADIPSDFYKGFVNRRLPVLTATTQNDVIDAILYGKTIDPAYGMTKVAVGKDFGFHTKHIKEVYPDKLKNIQVYEINTPKGVSEDLVIPQGRPHGAAPNATFFRTVEGPIIDAGGHIEQFGVSESVPYDLVKAEDIYAFNPKRYKTNYKNILNENSLYDKIINFGLNRVYKHVTPIVSKTKWQTALGCF